MNLAEATAIVGTVKALCPSQQMDKYTPAAWEMALFDVSAADAAEALRRLARRESQPGDSRYIETGHIRGEVARLRQERIDKHPHVEPPSGLTPAQFLAWHRDIRERIANGERIEQPALEPRPMPELASLLKSVDDAV